MLPIGLFAQGLSVPGVTPSMLSQFSSMTPDQRRELASQYGINLEDMGLSDGSLAPNNIGMTGSELISESNQIILLWILPITSCLKLVNHFMRMI